MIVNLPLFFATNIILLKANEAFVKSTHLYLNSTLISFLLLAEIDCMIKSDIVKVTLGKSLVNLARMIKKCHIE